MRRLSTISGMQVKSLMTLLLTMIAMTLLALLLTLFPTPIQAATPFTTNGNFSVGSDGSANYSIPIQVPPGTSGMTPTLSLNYNSNGGNGILGMGWGLDGLSQISRCPKTIIQDGAVGGVNYDVNDKLCLDGQRLISTGGTYGGNATEYRTEQANFAKIISYTSTTANGPDYFKVWTKAGQIIEYGNSPDSRIEAAGKAVVRTWGVSKISDTKGNYLTVSYTEDNANGEAYIQRIDYTGNASSTPVVTPYASVQFSYETRPDISTGYHAGSVIKSTKRISNIKTYAPASTTNNTPTLVKDYRLTYEQGTATQRSRLKTLTECDGQTTPVCQQPVGLGFGSSSNGLIISASYALPTSISSDTIHDLGTRFVDLNGDGLEDFVYARHYGTGVISQAWLNTGSGWLLSASYALPAYINSDSIGDLGTRFVDLNGDGLEDFVYARHYGTGAISQAWLNTGSGWLLSASYALPAYINSDSIGDLGTRFVDLNGDGLEDFVYARHYGTGAISQAWLNTGSGWLLSASYALPTSISSDTIHDLGTRFVDLNGDGLEDFVYARHYGTGVISQAWLNTGSGWLLSASYALPAYINSDSIGDLGTRFVDLNGDGLEDFVYARHYGTGAISQAWLNTGSGWLLSASYALPAYINSDSIGDLGTRFVDLNGDGLEDFVYARHYGTGAISQAWLNTGSGWLLSASYALPTSISSDTIHDLGTRFVDLNGDGLEDFVYARHYGTGVISQAWLNQASSDLLTTLTPGLSSTISLTYKPITDSSVYVKDTAATVGTTTCPLPVGNTGTAGTYPIVEVQEPMYVVSTATDSDGNGGVLTNNYNYGGLKAHVTGRGSLGFRYQKVTQVDPDINSTTFFRQDYPYIGLPCQTEKRITSSNTLIGASALTYANSPITTGNAISQFPYLSQAVEQSFELTGTLINSTTTTNQYDTYGNPTQISVNSGDGYVKTTTNVYNNDASNWLLGRLLRSTVTSTTP